MIGDFRFSADPPDDVVRIHMYWDGTKRVAKVLLPAEVKQAAHEVSMLATDELGLGPALAYGIAMATTSERSLLITGDKSAWPDAWGQLTVQSRH